MIDNSEPVDFNVFIPCQYRTDNNKCVGTNDDCFIDNVPANCPLLLKEGDEK